MPSTSGFPERSPAPLSALPALHWLPKASPLLSPLRAPFRTQLLLPPSPPDAAGVAGMRLLGGSARCGEMRKLAELVPKSADCHIQSCSPGSEKIWSR